MGTCAAQSKPRNMFSGSSKRNLAYLKRLVIGVLCLNLLVLLLTAVLLVENKRTHEESALIVVTNLSRLLENEIVDTYEKIDLALRSVADEFNELSESDRSGTIDWNLRLAHIRDSLPVLSGLRATDTSGMVIYGLGNKDLPRVNVADRDHFIRLRDDRKAGLFISSPLQGRVTGQWSIILARRLNYQDGSFGGVVAASVPLDYFSNLFGSLKLYSKGSIGFRDNNLRLIVRYPAAGKGAVNVGATKIADDFKQALEENPNIGSYTAGLTSIDGVRRLHHYRRNAAYGFYINVGFAHDDIFSAWHQLIWQTSAIVGLFVFGSLAFVWHMRRSIIEQQSVTDQLEQSENRYKDIVENQTDFVDRFLPGGILTYVNDALAKFSGMEAKELLGKSFYPLMYEEEREEAIRRIESISIENRIVETENRIVLPNGKVRWNRWTTTGIFNDNGLLVEYQSVGQDITERKQAEDELNRFFDLVPDMVCIASTDGHLKKINKEWENVLGYSREEILGIPFYDLIHPDDMQATLVEVEKQLEGESSKNYINRYRCKDGSYRWLEWVSSSALDMSNLFAAARDITLRRQAEEEKQVLEHQFQQTQKLESLGVLSGGIAHDFNNILAIILGYCSLTKMDYETTENNIEEIEKAVERAAGLCRQMLAYAGKAQLDISQINVRMLVDEMVTMLKSTLPQNAVIKPELPANIPFVIGDASQLRQIIMNLIINASEAIGKEHGEIRVSLARTTVTPDQSDKDYNGKSIPPGEYVCLEVTDNGCGMDEETKWRIFEPFYTTKFTGRGLGMSAVLGIINSHNGALQLFSQLGQGTTLKVYLPAQKSDFAEDEDHTKSVPSVPWQGSGTILLVEDEGHVRFIAKALLKNIGFSVLEAANGKEALELYQRNATDITLVFTDMGMPIMDEYELFYELKKLNPELPIIVSSGYGDAEVSSRLSKEGIAGVINKPYGPDQLREVLKMVLDSERCST